MFNLVRVDCYVVVESSSMVMSVDAASGSEITIFRPATDFLDVQDVGRSGNESLCFR